MTVAELIEYLRGIEQHRIIVIASDGEGNDYSEVSCVERAAFARDLGTCRTGEIGLEKLTPDLKKRGYTRDDVIKGEPCLVLYPY